MTLDAIRRSRDTRPFEPFEIVLVDGRSFTVDHPEFILVPPGRGTWVYVAEPSGKVEHINTVIISSIRKSTNERSRRRKKAG
jgi:hypothetical protein